MNSTFPFVKQAIELEDPFRKKNQREQHGTPAILVQKGFLPLILSAPHAVQHPRWGGAKDGEIYTGALALQIAFHTGASTIVYARTIQEDPNYDQPGPYKERLAVLARETSAQCVFDLHGMVNEFTIDRNGQQRTIQRDMIIDTANMQSLRGRKDFLAIVQNALQENSITNVSIDEYFTADDLNTITSFTANTLKIPAMQIEIARSFRSPRRLPQKYEALTSALIEAVNAIAKRGTEPGFSRISVDIG